jgi:hypothetical protein
MESSIIFPTTFDPKFEKSAELIAYLTNGIAYRDNGDIRVAGKSELNKLIAEKYEHKDFIGANEVLEAAKKTFETTSEELAERVSRSVRVPAPTYLKLVETALRGGVSLASVMRTVVLGPAIKSALDELSRRPEVAPDRLSRVEAVFEDWNESESAKHGGYSLDFTYERSLGVCEVLTRYAEFEFFRLCAALGAPKEAAELYWSYVVSPSDTLYGRWLMETKDRGIHISYDWILDEAPPPFVHSINDVLYLGYYLHLGVGSFVNHQMFYTAMDDIREKFGQGIVDLIADTAYHFNVAFGIESGHERTFRGTEETYLNEYEEGDVAILTNTRIEFDIMLKVGGDRVYLDGIEVCEENRNAIAENILTEHLHGTALDEQATQKDIQNAINADDLDKASDLSKKLAEYSVRMGVSEWITNSLFSAIETSEVITFTIPPIFSPILNSLQENKQIPDLVERYLQKGQVNADS